VDTECCPAPGQGAGGRRRPPAGQLCSVPGHWEAHAQLSVEARLADG
jgi:hypothetical protein